MRDDTRSAASTTFRFGLALWGRRFGLFLFCGVGVCGIGCLRANAKQREVLVRLRLHALCEHVYISVGGWYVMDGDVL